MARTGKTRAAGLKYDRLFSLWCTNGNNGVEAARGAGFKGSNKVLSVTASKVLALPKYEAVIKAFQAQAMRAAEREKNKDIADVRERKIVLTEIVRGRLTDYTHAGPDGDQTNIGPESKNLAALSEITTVTKYDSDGSQPRVVQRIKLRDPVQAIAELNKMDRVYDREPALPPGVTRMRITEIEYGAIGAPRPQIDAPEGHVISCTDESEGQVRRE